MDKEVKIIAMYLPQYHSIPENDEFWGQGFTDWVSVKNSKPLFKGHKQPRVPISGNYYDLSCKKDIVNQISLAHKSGIYGFGIYHYWFNNEKNLLKKPAEIIRDSKELDINYCFAWDNISWKRSWSNVKGNDWSPLNDNNKKEGPAVLIPYILGHESDWLNHFNYLLSHFKEERYIKVEGKPLFVIYHYSDQINEMAKYWDSLAQEQGFAGMFFVFRYDPLLHIPSDLTTFTYEPVFSGWGSLSDRFIAKVKKRMHVAEKLKIYDYNTIWEKIIDHAVKQKDHNRLHGAFVTYDDTPRRGSKGKIILNDSPCQFNNYMKRLIDISEFQQKELIFLTAWNEWGEGAYLEPDETYGMSYIDALKDAIVNRIR